MGKLIDIETIRKEIERLNNMEYPCDTSEQSTGFYDALERLEQFLDTLPEEKPVDLEKEVNEWAYFYPCFDEDEDKLYGKRVDYITEVAKHFYCIGRMAKKD